MRLLLAIEPDVRQAALIAALARDPLRAELVVASSAGEALAALGDRIPNLILTSQLLSPRDESVLTDRLRELDAAGQRVQTLVIPVLGGPTSEPPQQTGLLARFGWRRPKGSSPDGCDPAIFAGQITEYLKRAVTDRPVARPSESRVPVEAQTMNVFTHVPESSVPLEGPAANVFAHLPASSAPVEELVADVFAHVPDSSVPVEDFAADMFAHVPASSTPVEELAADVLAHVPASSAPVEDFAADMFAQVPVSSVPAEDPKPSVLDEEPMRVEASGQSTDESAGVFEDAVLAELAAMFAAVPPQASVEQNTDDARSDSELIELTRTPEIESAFAPLVQSVVVPPMAPPASATLEPAEQLPSEPRPAPFAVQSHLLELLAAIQRDLEPLRMDKSRATRKTSATMQDEWGFFDPSQCGIAALFARLEQTTENAIATSQRSA